MLHNVVQDGEDCRFEQRYLHPGLVQVYCVPRLNCER